MPSMIQKESSFLKGLHIISQSALNKAIESLSQLMLVSVNASLSNINLMDVSELNMLLSYSKNEKSPSFVCQSFISPGFAGEAFIHFDKHSFSDLSKIMQISNNTLSTNDTELLMDIANIFLGAYLQGIAKELDIKINQNHPIVLNEYFQINHLTNNRVNDWSEAPAIEINYHIKEPLIQCSLILILTISCLPYLKKILQYSV
jgi:chemotaxis protein CheY-P-specific phosphatase CheC